MPGEGVEHMSIAEEAEKAELYWEKSDISTQSQCMELKGWDLVGEGKVWLLLTKKVQGLPGLREMSPQARRRWQRSM